MRDEDDNFRLVELCPQERGVPLFGLWRSCEEALRIEVVVLPDEERTESADGLKVRRGGGPDAGQSVDVFHVEDWR